MQSKAATVAEYLESLPADRREVLATVREFLRKHLDPKLEERMSYGMIGYAVPHRLYPAGYHCDPKMPLPYGGLASQKGHHSLYLMALYFDENAPETQAFRDAWAKTGKKLDMGKSCIRFKKLDDLAFDVLAGALRSWTVDKYIATYDEVLGKMRSGKGGSAAKQAPAKAAAKPAAAKAKQPAAKKAAKAVKAAAAKKASAKKAPAKKAPAKPPAAKKTAKRARAK